MTSEALPRGRRSDRWVIAIALGIGAVLGQAGGMVGHGPAQNVLWAMSSVGLVVGCILVGAHQARGGNDLVAAGFATLAIGEALIWAGGPVTGPGGRTSFAGGVLFYVPALLLISVPRGLPLMVRLTGAIGVLPWALYAALFLTGRDPSPTGAIAIAGYILLTAAVVGWIIAVVRSSPKALHRPETDG